jgi:hypothetical protein
VINWKGFVRKRSWHNCEVLSRHLPGMTEGNHENLSQDSRSPGRDLNPGCPEYEGVLNRVTMTFGIIVTLEYIRTTIHRKTSEQQ